MEHKGVAGKTHFLKRSYVLTFFPAGIVQDLDLEVELLGKHVVQIKVCIAPESKDHVDTDLGSYCLVKSLIPVTFFDA